METKVQQLEAAIVRILKKEGGSMPWEQLFNRLETHILLMPSYNDILDAIGGLIRTGRAAYRGDHYTDLVVWLSESAPPVPPVDTEAIKTLKGSLE
jgi:hypothetical protein